MAKKKRGAPGPCEEGLPYEVVGPPHVVDLGLAEPSWRTALPSDREPSFIPLVRVCTGGKLYGYTVCQRCEIADMHYVPGLGSVPHVIPEELCLYCRQGWRLRVYGYWGCLLWPKQTLAVFELTWDCLRTNPHIADRNAALRGRGIKLERVGKGKRCRVFLTVAERDQTPADVLRTLPAEYDVRAAMNRIWGLRPPALPEPLDVAADSL